MDHVDPDIIFALKKLAADGGAQRVLKRKEKYEKRTERQFETQMQLLVDEVERVVPRTHPLFDLVLIVAVARKIEKSQQEPEFHSFVDEGFPQGW
jgi:hypothetical protein